MDGAVIGGLVGGGVLVLCIAAIAAYFFGARPSAQSQDLADSRRRAAANQLGNYRGVDLTTDVSRSMILDS